MRSGRPTAVVLWAVLLAGCGGSGDEAGKMDLVGSARPEAAPEEPARTPTVDPIETHRRAFVVDLIQDLVFRKRRDGWTLDTPEAHVNLAKLEAGGVDLAIAALPCCDPGQSPEAALEAAFREMEALVEETGGRAVLVSGLGDARARRSEGVMPLMILVEGADGFGGSPDRLYDLRRRGLSVVGLVGSSGNSLAEAAASPRREGGLTERGAAFVSACRDRGIAVDLTHASAETFWDVLVEEGAVPLVTHTAARALRDHPRNLNDLQILALARAGGAMGLVLNPDLIAAGQDPDVGIPEVVAHARHVRDIGAVGALALGTDFGGIRPPRGLEDVSRLPALTRALAEAGFGPRELEGVLGGNAMRVLEAADRRAGAEPSPEHREPLRPVRVECDVVIGEADGVPERACDGYLTSTGPRLPPASRQKLRLREMDRVPAKLEIFGDPGTPWQVEAQDLEGEVLVHRTVALDPDGRGAIPLPERRNLTRVFLSPTRPSALREAVVWGR